MTSLYLFYNISACFYCNVTRDITMKCKHLIDIQIILYKFSFFIDIFSDRNMNIETTIYTSVHCTLYSTLSTVQ